MPPACFALNRRESLPSILRDKMRADSLRDAHTYFFSAAHTMKYYFGHSSLEVGSAFENYVYRAACQPSLRAACHELRLSIPYTMRRHA